MNSSTTKHGFIKAVLRSSTLLKLAACIIAYFLWSLLSDLYPVHFSYTVPVLLPAKQGISVKKAPSHIKVTFQGLRRHLRSLDLTALNVIIPLEELHEGTNLIKLNNLHFALPESITVIDYTPLNFTIVIDKIGLAARDANNL
jgi:hypothetical protein